MKSRIMGEPAVNQIVGMTVEEARKHLEPHGKVVRVIIEDGSSKMVTMEVNDNRANVIVENGIIIEVDRMG